MGLTIQWQMLAEGDGTIVPVVTAFAVLNLYVSGSVIRHSEWVYPPARQDANRTESELQRQIRQKLEQPDVIELHVDLLLQGTEFSQRVWSVLNDIPFGETLTYAQVAQRVGSGARAVANACKRNPFPGLIPCHRVVAARDIGGFMGQSEGAYVELKRRILTYEAAKTGGNHEFGCG